jgi:hypothetical protein
MAYTFNKLDNGNVEVLQDGQRISTGTESAASRYGYQTPEAQKAGVSQIDTTQSQNNALIYEIGYGTASSTFVVRTKGNGANDRYTSLRMNARLWAK